MNPIFLFTWLGLAVAPAQPRAEPASDPVRLLLPVVHDDFLFNGEITMRMDSWLDEPATVQIETVKGKGAKVTWIHPSTMQGVAYFDDGRQIRQYFPDKNLLRLRKSFQSFWPDAESLLNLTAKNYTVKDAGRTTRIGREANIVVATAKYQELGSRRFLIDSRLPVVLEDRHTAGGDTIVRLQAIQLREMPPGEVDLSLGAPANAAIAEGWGPKDITDMKFAAGVLKFTPRIPEKIPFGFAVFAKQLVGREEQPFLVVRITDGLATAHIYEWRYGYGANKSMAEIPATLVDSRSDIAYSIVGDLPPKASEIVLQSFVSALD